MLLEVYSGPLLLPNWGQSFSISPLPWLPHSQHTLLSCGYRASLSHSTEVDESYPLQSSYFYSPSPLLAQDCYLLRPEPTAASYLAGSGFPLGAHIRLVFPPLEMLSTSSPPPPCLHLLLLHNQHKCLFLERSCLSPRMRVGFCITYLPAVLNLQLPVPTSVCSGPFM